MEKSYKVPTKLEKHLRKNKKAWSRKGLVAILTYSLALILLGVMGKSCWDGYWRTHSWRFQSPVIFQTPLIIKEIKPQAQKVLTPEIDSKTQGSAKLNANNDIVATSKTEKEIVMAQPHGKVLWNIYDLESQRGETDYCRLNGKGWGGFGVKDGQKPVSQIVCYETFAKAAERAEYWFARLNPDKDLATALCTWNTGKPEVNCHYYQNYLTY